MRTTDDLNPERFQPLGQKVPPPAPPPKPEWTQVPGAEKGVGIGPDGRLSTRIPGNTVWHPMGGTIPFGKV